MKPKFYLTTPIYYVNDIPHIGHAYTTIAADVLARYKRLKGFDVFFLTGTDEHGQKIAEAAAAKGKKPKEFCDEIVVRFKSAWEALNISYNDFIRTTEDRHITVVQEVFSRLLKSGDIYSGEYEGWYCTPCETFWTDMQMKEAKLNTPKAKTEDQVHEPHGHNCPDCGRPVTKLKEATFFFKLSKYEKELLRHIEDHPEFIQPESRRNEVISFVKSGLKDLSVTRTAFSWGVPVKEDPKHVIYVWFDALINYISAPGYVANHARFDRLWPADAHLMGKEIVRFHAVIWACMLLALKLKLPHTIFGHGWWTSEGQKMSKSKGNVIDPIGLSKEFGVDAVRYFLLREVPFGTDGDYSRASLIHKFNSDLANDIGNLLNRTLTMVEKYFSGNVEIPAKPDFDANSAEIVSLIRTTPDTYSAHMDKLQFSDALATVWKLINLANTYIEKEAPWKLSKEGKTEELKAVMYNLVQSLTVSAILVQPFMPQVMENMWKQLGHTSHLIEDAPAIIANIAASGVKVAGKISKGNPLFPRIEIKQ
jgi:methionyl-tRNA synthetase